jgi:hypothetical protein
MFAACEAILRFDWSRVAGVACALLEGRWRTPSGAIAAERLRKPRGRVARREDPCRAVVQRALGARGIRTSLAARGTGPDSRPAAARAPAQGAVAIADAGDDGRCSGGMLRGGVTPDVERDRRRDDATGYGLRRIAGRSGRVDAGGGPGIVHAPEWRRRSRCTPRPEAWARGVRCAAASGGSAVRGGSGPRNASCQRDALRRPAWHRRDDGGCATWSGRRRGRRSARARARRRALASFDERRSSLIGWAAVVRSGASACGFRAATSRRFAALRSGGIR